jgi:ADP-L-glycero-D-manno-heptose 6-epimerase
MTRSLIMITGGAGFIGSNVVAELLGQGEAEVAVCDRLRSAQSGKWRNLAKHSIADLVAPEALPAWLDGHASELTAIVHMAAISSTVEPDADLVVHNNFTLSKRLWDWAAEAGVRFVYASSAATYGDGALGFDDADDLVSLGRLRPLNPYGWSKGLFDLYARRQADAGRAPPSWAGLKFFNVYGPNEYHKGAMRSVVDQIWPSVRDGAPVTLFRSHRPDYPDGGQLRDFVYVKDAAAATAWLARRGALAGIYNLGSGQARSFKDLALAVFAVAGRSDAAAINYIDTPETIRPQYQYFTEARIERLRALGYVDPFFALEAGVADYVTHYLSQPDPYR